MLKHTTEPSPVAVEKGKRPETKVLPDHRWFSLGTSSTSEQLEEKRGSSLRFSILSYDSPGAADQAVKEPQSEHSEVAGGGSTTTSLATPGVSPNPKSRSISARTRRFALKSSDPKPPSSRRRMSEADTMLSQSASVAMSEDVPTLSFFQARQVDAEVEAPPVMSISRDASNLSQTINELTRDVLGTMRDLEGVMSQ